MQKQKLHKIELTLEELLRLDGKVSKETQKIINQAKQEDSYGFDFPIMNEILRKSEKTGILTWCYKSISSCKYCDKTYDYYTYPKSSRYHDKGDKNLNKPKYYSGIKFNEGFVRMQGYGDMCTDCEKEYNVIHKLIDYIINNDLQIEIQKNDYRPSKYLKDEIEVCYSCGKEMLKSTMGGLPTAMGGGYYKGTCPHCGAEERPFGKSHKTTDKFGMILNPEFRDEVQNIRKLISEYNNSVEIDDDKINFKQHKNNIDIFIVEEYKWTNGHRKVIQFDTKSKTYEVGYFWEDKDVTNLFIKELNENDYKSTDKNNRKKGEQSC